MNAGTRRGVLTGEEILVLAFVVMDGHSEAEVASYLTALLPPRIYTRERVHRIKRTALNKLRPVLADWDAA
jgi:hypothetical protein